MQVLLRPAAAADLDGAYQWYEEQRSELGEEFLTAFRNVVRLILENPRQYAVVRRNTRRALLRRFPYAVFYRVYSETLVIVACMHTRRDPLRWMSRNPR